jgi:t-SNARE complex subunit (syntaxin)
MQEVNELMNEMSEFYDESEETSDLIEESCGNVSISSSLFALNGT